MRKWPVMFVGVWLVALSVVQAQELNFFEGSLSGTHSYLVRPNRHDDNSFTWLAEYRQDLNENTAASLAWVNEGHLPRHRRDGLALQMWRRARTCDDRLTFSAGLGPYLWSDTEWSPDYLSWSNLHGLGAVASLDSTWRLGDRWQVALRSNWIVGHNSINTRSLNLGLGYLLAFDEPGAKGGSADEAAAGQGAELTLFGGQCVPNDPAPQSLPAWALEYRRPRSERSDWTVTLLSEHGETVNRQLGLAAQLWTMQRFSQGRLSLGAGLGGYLAIDKNETAPVGAETVSPLLTLSVARQLGDRWQTRFSWNRLFTHNDSDADIVLLGLGYRFGQ